MKKKKGVTPLCVSHLEIRAKSFDEIEEKIRKIKDCVTPFDEVWAYFSLARNCSDRDRCPSCTFRRKKKQKNENPHNSNK